MRWVRHARYRMGTVWEMVVWTSDREQALRAIDSAFEDVAQLERLMSRFLPESQLNDIARAAGQQAVVIDPALYEVLAYAQAVAAVADGAFDVTMGPLLLLWTKAAASGVLPTAVQLRCARACVGYQALRIERDGPRAALLHAGMSLDLGAIGKGFAVDCAVECLQAQGYTEGWVNAGGNVRFLGSWEREVAVRDPCQPDQILLRLVVERESVSTSANYERAWQIGGHGYGHLLDPRTGWPASSSVSVTVLAPSAALADALSTACFVLGPEQGRLVCSLFRRVEALWFIRASTGQVELVATPGLSERITCVARRRADREGAHAAISVASR